MWGVRALALTHQDTQVPGDDGRGGELVCVILTSAELKNWKGAARQMKFMGYGGGTEKKAGFRHVPRPARFGRYIARFVEANPELACAIMRGVKSGEHGVPTQIMEQRRVKVLLPPETTEFLVRMADENCSSSLKSTGASMVLRAVAHWYIVQLNKYIAERDALLRRVMVSQGQQVIVLPSKDAATSRLKIPGLEYLDRAEIAQLVEKRSVCDSEFVPTILDLESASTSSAKSTPRPSHPSNEDQRWLFFHPIPHVGLGWDAKCAQKAHIPPKLAAHEDPNRSWLAARDMTYWDDETGPRWLDASDDEICEWEKAHQYSLARRKENLPELFKQARTTQLEIWRQRRALLLRWPCGAPWPDIPAPAN